ncbi:MAG TPA: flavin reductase family protein [Longimicrobiales bacterium]
MDASEFRRILGHWGTGVAVVTTRLPDGRPWGLTANAFASVSLQPPLVLVCVDLTSDTHAGLRAAGFFAVSVLAAEQERIARRFADGDVVDKFEGIAWRAEATGAPVLEDVTAWVDCRVEAEHPAGDHSIFVGEVVAGDAGGAAPLLYYRGGYGRFEP